MMNETRHNITLEIYQKVYDENILLHKTNEEYCIEITSLKLQLLQLQKMIFGFKSEAFKPSPIIPAAQGLLFDVAPLATVVNTVEEKIIKKNSYTIIPHAKKHNGRNELPENIRREEIIIEPTVLVEGAKKIGEEITEQLGYKSAEIYVVKTIRPKYVLPNEEGIVIAPMVENAMPKCIAAPSLVANIIIEKFVDHIPIYRQVGRFIRLGIEMNESTILGWLKQGDRLLHPLFVAMKKEVLNSHYLQVDESTIKVLDKEKKGTTHLGYYWLYHDCIQKIIWYDYHKSRGTEAPNLALENFTGHLQTDGYAAYEHFDLDPNIIHLCCMAHARRKFFDAQDNDASRATYFLDQMHKLYAIEREIKEKSKEERIEARLLEATPILLEIKQWLLENTMQVLPKSPIGIAINYSLARWDKLMIYATTDFLQIDNNLIENKVRPLAIGRKNYLFAGSHEAATRNGNLYSVLVTCKLNNINPQKWLEYVITNISNSPINRIADLLPHKINPDLLK